MMSKKSLTNHTWFRLKDTYALDILSPNNFNQLMEIVSQAELPYLILGNGSNILLDSFPGIIIKTQNLNGIEFFEGYVVVEAGVNPKQLLSLCMSQAECGFEFMSTIPGTIGGMMIMNAGAHGDCMANHVLWVEVLKNNKICKIYSENIEFAYRKTSIEGIVLRVALKTVKINPNESKLKISKMIEYINSVQPRSMTLGSTFKNPTDFPAWKLIDSLDQKFTTSNNVEFSSIHRNFMINKGNSTVLEARNLIDTVREKIFEKYGINLELEIKVQLKST